MLEAENRPAEAIALLEGVLKRSWSDTCTAEAAIELARLRVKAKQGKEARQALEFAVGFLEEQTKRELSAVAAAPFIAAAKAAMGRLKYDTDPGRTEPRLVKREPVRFAYLRIPRDEARQQCLS
jgi:hypothetical protein